MVISQAQGRRGNGALHSAISQCRNVSFPALDFPETYLLDDLSSQTPVPPTYLVMQNKLPELGKVDKKPLGFVTGYGTQNRVPLGALSVSPTCNRVQPTGGSFNAERN